ncbi:hypothetical protein BGZ99_010422 [Dissophora globulifera]|uniref:Uncharacterized protein n=1 Tax=Dissophora globulifera TaxID=979702 RepID=A0A9P6UM91_9FUNG|nr:hypothetical protein BGZ99_010422 [Dissophora globulifera]
MTANTAAAATAPAPVAEEPIVSSHEVGMMFVHEYYTFLNKEPQRLHCFYNKDSTMSHGVQGEESQSIHTKILELDFEDCKVLVNNVDSQSSLNEGIMVQVVGEMSNKGGPSQKFVQTFFLAKQPKGYYVKNDIFRYLKEDTDFEVDVIDVVVDETVAAEDVALVDDGESATPVDIPALDVAAVVDVAVVDVVVVEDKKPVEKKQEHKKKRDSKKDLKKDTAAESAEKPKTPEPTNKKQEAAAAAQVESNQTETAAKNTTVEAATAPVAAPAPLPTEPPKPKTWANLAANNPTQWGSHVSSAKGSSINVVQPTPKPQSPQPNAAASQNQNRPQGQRPVGRDDVHGIYVKSVTEKMSIDQLREAFSKFGPVKNVELAGKRNCAYVDFESAEAVQAALKQNKVNVGSEVVLAEERRRSGFPAGNRPFHYQNGNGPHNHQGPPGGPRGGRTSRGGFQDRKSFQKPEKAAPTVAVN